jgi:ubiquinone/menaquinone biosynthesis C-methylase UbiE
MTQGLRGYAGYLVYRTMGTIPFVRRLEWRRMIDWLEPQPGEKVLDIACGAGELSLAIARRGGEVYGIDMSAAAIDYARGLSKRAGIAGRFEIGDAESLPYADSFFDKIVCSSSLEHFTDDGRALREMTRVLKPGGRAILTVDSFNYPISEKLRARHREEASVARYYTKETLEANLRAAGQELRRSEYLLNSALTGLFVKLGIRYRLPAPLALAVSFFGYPAFRLSEKAFGRRGTGFTLLAESRKPA